MNRLTDSPKVVSYRSKMSLRVLLFITFTFNCTAGAQGVKTSKSASSFKTHEQTETSLWSVNHNRKQRAANGAEPRCFDEMAFQTGTEPECFYDRACFTIFSDCCPDYEKRCGPQELYEPKTSVWKCIDWDSYCSARGETGAWMVFKCPAYWPIEKSRSRCENAPPKIFDQISYPIEDHIPVVGANGYTYRNGFCALCNGMKNHTAWNLEVSSPVVPPEGLDLNSKLKFIEKYGGKIDGIYPSNEQSRRFCYGRNYIANCSLTNDTSYETCVKGPVAIVNRMELHFKNTACAKCNGYPGLTAFKYTKMCSRGGFKPFSLVFKLKDTGEKVTTSTVIYECPPDMVYDTDLNFCRDVYRERYLSSGSFPIAFGMTIIDQFFILLWLKQPEMRSTLVNHLRLALASQFSLQPLQISPVILHRLYSSTRYAVPATFTFTLTPFQILIMRNQHRANSNFTRKQSAFLQLLNFTGNFTIVGESYSFSVISVTSKQLYCYGEKILEMYEYKIMNKTKRLVLNETGEELLLKDYTLHKQEHGYVTLCRKLVWSDCAEGAYVPLNSNEYIVFPNLSVYHYATESIFKFGDYLISERSTKDRNDSSTMGYSILSTSSAISVCLPFKNTFNVTETSFVTSSSRALEILTITGFSISIVCLVLLLMTYTTFQELRTVPGKNLMNLSFSLFLSQLTWLVGLAFVTGRTACKVFAILEHYLLLVSFLAMSVISYHTCHVFSKPFVGRIANTSSRRFIKYSVVLWITPAIFVAICIALDETEAFEVDYGTNCWLGTANAKLYLFLLPLALLLLYNISTFIRTAVSLSRHEKERRALHQKQGRQNLLICTKLATLVGLPWLFAFLGVFFPDVEAFEYLFVVFVCLQGLYIGMAFLFDKKAWKLYKDRFNTRCGVTTRSYAATPAFKLT